MSVDESGEESSDEGVTVADSVQIATPAMRRAWFPPMRKPAKASSDEESE